jgi:hypothetical protein
MGFDGGGRRHAWFRVSDHRKRGRGIVLVPLDILLLPLRLVFGGLAISLTTFRRC